MKQPFSADASTDAKAWVSLFDQLSDGVCISDADFRIVYLNPAARRILRLDERPGFGVTICELVSLALPTPGLGRCGPTCPLQEHPLQGVATWELEGVRIRCLAAPEGIGGGSLHLTLLEDVRAEFELRKHQEDWRNMVAHDLRTPLTPVLATLMILAENASLPPAELRLVTISIDAAKRMLELLNLYLDVARLDAGLMPVRPSRVPVAEAARRAADEQAALAQQRRQELAVEAPEDLAVRADPNLLMRVLQNLVNNALKYTPEGGRIVISAERTSRGVRLSVKDNGQGIPPGDQAKLFDRFFQAQARREGNTTGTGLGLAFCKQALDAMGGRIYVLSEPGAGSEFSIILPEFPASPAGG